MTSPREYTQAQLKAFAWLRSNQEWRTYSPFTNSLNSLCRRLLVESRPYGRRVLSYRLTPAGQAEKARLIAERKIEP